MENTQPSMQSKDLQLQEAVFLQERAERNPTQNNRMADPCPHSIHDHPRGMGLDFHHGMHVSINALLKFFTVDPTPAVMTRNYGEYALRFNRHGTQFHGAGDILSEAPRALHVLFVPADCEGKLHLCAA